MVAIEQVYRQIEDIARAHGARRVVLFGSRARGDASPRSDIDIAVEGCVDFPSFYDDVQENLWSLLEIDVVNLDGPVAPELQREIARNERTLYEEI